MTEIPEHLLRRAQAARERAHNEAQASHPSTTEPPHLGPHEQPADVHPWSLICMAPEMWDVLVIQADYTMTNICTWRPAADLPTQVLDTMQSMAVGVPARRRR